MSKMNELSVDYDSLEKFEESERQKLRDEGKEEFRKELVAKITSQQSWHQSESAYDQIWFHALQWSIDVLNGKERI